MAIGIGHQVGQPEKGFGEELAEARWLGGIALGGGGGLHQSFHCGWGFSGPCFAACCRTGRGATGPKEGNAQEHQRKKEATTTAAAIIEDQT